ncbi:hypothetical protein NDU88_002666 [Pleurodeles waltl]|uniref:Uncharacterized protein n=1 Tax=Pleurodeles waltl TaxID=8319 RepID=A0AAV7PFY2_PLEWA|nr:hypothetical protein NDU88_002666 [Pleurodeles waltl]
MRYHHPPIRQHIRVMVGFVNPSSTRPGWQHQQKHLGKRQVEERDLHPGEVGRTIRVSAFTVDSWPHKQNTTMLVSSPIQRPDNQEATTLENWPHSGESMALAEQQRLEKWVRGDTPETGTEIEKREYLRRVEDSRDKKKIRKDRSRE